MLLIVNVVMSELRHRNDEVTWRFESRVHFNGRNRGVGISNAAAPKLNQIRVLELCFDCLSLHLFVSYFATMCQLLHMSN